MHLDAGPRTFAEYICKFLAYVARPVNIAFKSDAALGTRDGLQHGREYLLSVE